MRHKLHTDGRFEFATTDRIRKATITAGLDPNMTVITISMSVFTK